MLNAAERLQEELGEEPAATSQQRKAREGDDVFALANSVDTIEVLDKLAIPHHASARGEMAKCPGCGEDGALVCHDGGLKCLHARCAECGPRPGYRSNVDLVAVVEGVSPLEAAKLICDWFGIAVPGTSARVADKGTGRSRATAEPASEPDEPEIEDWCRTLHCDEKGRLTRGVANVIVILANDEAWSGVVGRNEFSAAEASFMRAPPWDAEYAPRTPPAIGTPWSDADDARAAAWLARHWELNVGAATVAEAIKVVAAKHAHHPVRDFFSALEWDRVPRLDSWVSTYLGADPSPYVSSIGRWWMISAVARVFRPGAKADHLVILEGPQGIGKSTALKVLASEQWFTDELGDLGSKDAALQLQGRLIVELAELDALGRAEISRAKAFLSRATDKFRPPWGRRTVEVPRQCVFAGSTNQSTYLKDESGARRFWPVRCQHVDLAGLEAARSQLWAEAVHLYEAGCPWWPTTDAHRAELGREQEQRRQVDPWEEPIEAWLRQPHGAEITTAGVLSECLGKKKADWTRADEMRVAACMKTLGFEQDRISSNGQRFRVWRRGSDQ